MGLQVRVPVIKAFTHEGRAFSVGESVTVSPIMAAALSQRGVVSLTKQDKDWDLSSPIVTLGRSALDAANALESSMREACALDGETEQPRRRRRYRRKDMVAEE
jgi:hypothetical protein